LTRQKGIALLFFTSMKWTTILVLVCSQAWLERFLNDQDDEEGER
jgi:hypothetical protein